MDLHRARGLRRFQVPVSSFSLSLARARERESERESEKRGKWGKKKQASANDARGQEFFLLVFAWRTFWGRFPPRLAPFLHVATL